MTPKDWDEQAEDEANYRPEFMLAWVLWALALIGASSIATCVWYMWPVPLN